jgi:hypothetical protein
LTSVEVRGPRSEVSLPPPTTLNYVYAFDADDPAQSAPLWRSPQLGLLVHRANLTAFKLMDPAIGIASTPVIDRASGTMYVVAKSLA